LTAFRFLIAALLVPAVLPGPSLIDALRGASFLSLEALILAYATLGGAAGALFRRKCRPLLALAPCGGILA
jgi:hypothetical protein